MAATEFVVYPAIDMRGGNCVRLYKGDYAQETVYGDPLEMAEKWVQEGAQWVHLVDLDGAKAGYAVQRDLVVQIGNAVSVPVQIGGGIRDMAQIEDYVTNGVSRVILGTSAIKNPSFVREALAEFGSRIAIGIDARNGYVATEGWVESSEIRADELAKRLAEAGAETFIFTDISKDGTLTGPSVDETVALAKSVGKEVIASGGIRSNADIEQLATYVEDGIGGVIVGKALYGDHVQLRQAIQAVQNGERR